MNNTKSLNKWLWLVHEFSFLQFIADCHWIRHFNLERINCLGRHFPPILSHCQRIHPFRPLTLPFVLIVQLKPFNKLLPWIVLRLASLKSFRAPLLSLCFVGRLIGQGKQIRPTIWRFDKYSVCRLKVLKFATQFFRPGKKVWKLKIKSGKKLKSVEFFQNY